MITGFRNSELYIIRGGKTNGKKFLLLPVMAISVLGAFSLENNAKSVNAASTFTANTDDFDYEISEVSSDGLTQTTKSWGFQLVKYTQVLYEVPVVRYGTVKFDKGSTYKFTKETSNTVSYSSTFTIGEKIKQTAGAKIKASVDIITGEAYAEFSNEFSWEYSQTLAYSKTTSYKEEYTMTEAGIWSLVSVLSSANRYTLYIDYNENIRHRDSTKDDWGKYTEHKYEVADFDLYIPTTYSTSVLYLKKYNTMQELQNENDKYKMVDGTSQVVYSSRRA